MGVIPQFGQLGPAKVEFPRGREVHLPVLALIIGTVNSPAAIAIHDEDGDTLYWSILCPKGGHKRHPRRLQKGNMCSIRHASRKYSVQLQPHFSWASDCPEPLPARAIQQTLGLPAVVGHAIILAYHLDLKLLNS